MTERIAVHYRWCFGEKR